MGLLTLMPAESDLQHLHLVLGWGSFCMSLLHQWNMEAIWLWFCWGALNALLGLAVFRPSALLGLVSLIFLFLFMFLEFRFAGESNTMALRSLKQALVPLAVWPSFVGKIIFLALVRSFWCICFRHGLTQRNTTVVVQTLVGCGGSSSKCGNSKTCKSTPKTP